MPKNKKEWGQVCEFGGFWQTKEERNNETERKMDYNPCMFHIVLVEPEIPQNTGNIIRSIAATGAMLHLIEPLGFQMDEKHLSRAGLDYFPLANILIHPCFEEYEARYPESRKFFFSSHATKNFTEVSCQDGDHLVFGKESVGLSKEIVERYSSNLVRIPMKKEARCINLSNAVAVGLFFALYQNGFPGLESSSPDPYLP